MAPFFPDTVYIGLLYCVFVGVPILLTGSKDVSETTIRALKAILDNSVAIGYTILLVEVATRNQE